MSPPRQHRSTARSSLPLPRETRTRAKTCVGASSGKRLYQDHNCPQASAENGDEGESRHQAEPDLRPISTGRLGSDRRTLERHIVLKDSVAHSFPLVLKMCAPMFPAGDVIQTPS